MNISLIILGFILILLSISCGFLYYHFINSKNKIEGTYWFIIAIVAFILMSIPCFIEGFNSSNPSDNSIHEKGTNSNLQQSLRDKISDKISNRTFYNRENDLATTIEFVPSQSGAYFGSATLFQLGCHYVFTYSINNSTIELTYYGSDCGQTSPNCTMNYDFSEDFVYMYFQGQKFIFK